MYVYVYIYIYMNGSIIPELIINQPSFWEVGHGFQGQ